jgi:hypothetical protein
MKRTTALVMTGFVVAVFASGCGSSREESGRDEAIGSTKSALSAEQCNYFVVGGKTRICHATGSAKNPFVILSVSAASCVDAHAGHAHDYVAVGDSTCNGQGCLPAGAPVDSTLGCCEGLTARDGTCQVSDLCRGVSCTSTDQCHRSTCNATNGKCEDEPLDAIECNDGNACTLGDSCHAGVCGSSGLKTCDPTNECELPGLCDPSSGACSNPTLPQFPQWADQDSDGLGDPARRIDACVLRGGFVPNPADNCPLVYNPDQTDSDGDGIGDACAPPPPPPDEERDSDGDGNADRVDNCPFVPNPDQSDIDSNGRGDACEDRDQDGVLDVRDNCPDRPNPDQNDIDQNGIGDACDEQDSDGDGVLDFKDSCPYDPACQ